MAIGFIFVIVLDLFHEFYWKLVIFALFQMSDHFLARFISDTPYYIGQHRNCSVALSPNFTITCISSTMAMIYVLAWHHEDEQAYVNIC